MWVLAKVSSLPVATPNQTKPHTTMDQVTTFYIHFPSVALGFISALTISIVVLMLEYIRQLRK